MKTENKYELDIKQIPVGDKLKLRILNRPKYSYAALLIVSFLFILFTPHFVKIIGVLLLAVTVVSLINIKDKKVIEIYDGYIVVYQNAPENKCYMFGWEDITSWRLGESDGQMDTFIINLNEDITFRITTYSNFGLNNHFQRNAKNAEIRPTTEEKLNQVFK